MRQLGFLLVLRGSLREMIAFLKLGALCRMPLPVPDAEILPYKGPIAVWEIASVNLLRSVVQLMAVEMFCAGIALAATFMCAFKFPVRVHFPGSPSFARAAGCKLVGIHVAWFLSFDVWFLVHPHHRANSKCHIAWWFYDVKYVRGLPVSVGCSIQYP